MRWPFTRRNMKPPDLLADDRAFAPEIRFTFKLFRELAARYSSANIFFSPSSVMLCLTIVYDGATEETRSDMANALQLSGLDFAGVDGVVSRLRSVAEEQDAGVRLLVSNSLWCSLRIRVDPAFRARTHEVYDAEVFEIDFAAGHVADKINAWVSEKTDGKIARMVDSLDRLTLLVALNAIYFKGIWKQPFQRSWTRDRPFTTGLGKQKIVPLMLQRGRFLYFEQRDFQAVVLPYQGARMAMYVFLPAAKSNLKKVHELLSAAAWEEWTKKFASTLGSVHLPRFKMNYEASLKTALTALGMASAFDPKRAEFGRIHDGPPPIWLDEILHRAVAEVNEEGTEAAAVTMTVMRALSATRREPPEPEFEIIVNRPFLFLIRDEASGNILFMGSLVDPTS